MIKSVKTEGIVLRKRSLPNQDLIIDFFSKDKGKLILFAKGIKKITSRRLPHTQVGNLIKVVLEQQDNRFYLQGSDLISGFTKIKEDNIKLPFFYFSIFLADRLLPEQQKEENVYHEILKFFIKLSKDEKFTISYLTRWTNKIMRLLGYLHEDKPYDELRGFIENIIEEKLPLV